MTIQENSVVSIAQDSSRVGLNYLTFQQSRLCSVVSDSLSVCKYCFYYSNEQIIETKEPFFSRANKLLVGKWAWIHLRHTRFPKASRPVLFHRFRGTRMGYAINRLSDTWNNYLKFHMQRLHKKSSRQRSLRKQPSRHLAPLPLVSPAKWRLRNISAEIPYWWPVTTQIWVVLLIGWIKFPTRHDQSQALIPRSGWWRVISMEFLRSFLRRHLVGNKW